VFHWIEFRRVERKAVETDVFRDFELFRNVGTGSIDDHHEAFLESAEAAAMLRLECSSRVRRRVCFSEAVHHGWMNLSCWKTSPKRARRNRR